MVYLDFRLPVDTIKRCEKIKKQKACFSFFNNYHVFFVSQFLFADEVKLISTPGLIRGQNNTFVKNLLNITKRKL